MKLRLSTRRGIPQANTLRPYLTCIRSTLEAALCLRNFPSQTVERHNRPEVEDRSSRELLLTPITITRTDKESTFIEPSINSTRVSIRIKQSDEVERLLAHKFTAFLQQRAEQFIILRRRPVAGYDLSFLITHTHLETMIKSKLIDFVIAFMEGALSTLWVPAASEMHSVMHPLNALQKSTRRSRT